MCKLNGRSGLDEIHWGRRQSLNLHDSNWPSIAAVHGIPGISWYVRYTGDLCASLCKYARMYVSLYLCGIWISDLPTEVQVPTYLPSYPIHPSIPSLIYLSVCLFSISLSLFLSPCLPLFYPSIFSFFPFPPFHPFPPFPHFLPFVYPSILLSFCHSMSLSTLSICPFVYLSNYVMSHLKKSTALTHFTYMSTLQFMIISCHSPCSETEIQYRATQKHMHNMCT